MATIKLKLMTAARKLNPTCAAYRQTLLDAASNDAERMLNRINWLKMKGYYND